MQMTHYGNLGGVRLQSWQELHEPVAGQSSSASLINSQGQDEADFLHARAPEGQAADEGVLWNFL